MNQINSLNNINNWVNVNFIGSKVQEKEMAKLFASNLNKKEVEK